VSELIGKHEARMGADLVTALCQWSEAAAKHLTEYVASQQADDLAARRGAASCPRCVGQTVDAVRAVGRPTGSADGQAVVAA
jgi:hypothetical protein